MKNHVQIPEILKQDILSNHIEFFTYHCKSNEEYIFYIPNTNDEYLLDKEWMKGYLII